VAKRISSRVLETKRDKSPSRKDSRKIGMPMCQNRRPYTKLIFYDKMHQSDRQGGPA
jgi:hypothetical protein